MEKTLREKRVEGGTTEVAHSCTDLHRSRNLCILNTCLRVYVHTMHSTKGRQTRSYIISSYGRYGSIS